MYDIDTHLSARCTAVVLVAFSILAVVHDSSFFFQGRLRTPKALLVFSVVGFVHGIPTPCHAFPNIRGGQADLPSIVVTRHLVG